MNVVLSKHYGMCFGVRDALRATHKSADQEPITVLGELVHNQVVQENLKQIGVKTADLAEVGQSPTQTVVITAHGAADRDRGAWKGAGYNVVDTTCPLVKKAHTALALLVKKGYHPVVIGKKDHVEVRGLTGDFPQADVVLTLEDVQNLPEQPRFGIISQTTQPLTKVENLVESIRYRHPESEVRFVDTVCQPTKDRQTALKELCSKVEVVVVVGGHNSNNTHQLVKTAEGYGVTAYHVSRPEDLNPNWFNGVREVGVTAGTSTLDETVQAVFDAVKRMGKKAG